MIEGATGSRIAPGWAQGFAEFTPARMSAYVGRVVRILLVSTPWASVDYPSLALGILKKTLHSAQDVQVATRYVNIDYAEWIGRKCQFDASTYDYFANQSYLLGVGDWVFAPALHGTKVWRQEQFREYLRGKTSDDIIDQSCNLQGFSDEFIRMIAADIARWRPDLVGFTTTFQQNMASLALARRLKEIVPSVSIALGGANCDGDQGVALHRNFDFIDFIFRGEADSAFPDLISALRGGSGFDGIPGLCWRDTNGRSVVNSMTRAPLPPSRIVSPEYDDYFGRISQSSIKSWAEPVLVLESSRGCWWGEKHQCTFCGLNGSSISFRSKDPSQVLREIEYYASVYRTMNIYFVDNILDMKYFRDLVPGLEAKGYDIKLFYETKSNLRRVQLESLARAGVASVQPGIESLNTRVLGIMDKGVTGSRNVRFLRDAMSVGIEGSWNYLYGFPGECDSDYEAVIDQIPAMVHLTPPESVSRIVVERFSPYFERPELGFDDLRLPRHMELNYNLPYAEAMAMSYMFDASPRGISEDLAERLRGAVSEWKRVHAHSRLAQISTGDEIIIVNNRDSFGWTSLRISDECELFIFRLLSDPRSIDGLCKAVVESGQTWERGRVEATLRRFSELGIVFHDNGSYVHIVPDATNVELLHAGWAAKDFAF